MIPFTYDLLKAFSQASNTRKNSITQQDANATELKQCMEVKAITRIKSKLSKVHMGAEMYLLIRVYVWPLHLFNIK